MDCIGNRAMDIVNRIHNPDAAGDAVLAAAVCSVHTVANGT